MTSLGSNLPYPMNNAIMDVLNWEDPGGYQWQNGVMGGNYERPTLPPLANNATWADRELYRRLQEIVDVGARGPYTADQDEYSLLPNLINETMYGAGPLATAQYNDPNIQNFLQAQRYNASLEDEWSPFGDQFVSAVAALGLATGGAALAGGFAAPAAGTAGAVGAGAADVVAPITAGAGASIAATPTIGAAPVIAGTGGAVAAGGTGGTLVASGGGGTAAAAPVAAGTPAATTGGGVLGTGLTASQAIKLGIPLASLAAGQLSGGGGGSDGGGVGPAPEQEALFQQFRDLGLATIPERDALMQEGYIDQTALANGSPMAMLAQVRPQVKAIREKLRQSFDAVSRRLGPSGGGQIERGEKQALQQGGSALQALFAGVPGQGLSGLLGATQGFRPTLLTELPHPTSVTTSNPNAFGDIAGGVKGYSELGKLVDQYTAKPITPGGTTTSSLSAASMPTNPYAGSPVGTIDEYPI